MQNNTLLNSQDLEERPKALRGQKLRERMVGSEDGQEAAVSIPLTQGLNALVSISDFRKVASFRWHVAKMSGSFRAKRSDYSKYKSGRVVFLHTAITGFVWVDHENRNTLDNRTANLRPCTPAQNAFNRKVPEMKFERSSKFKGVCWHKRIKKWHAHIGFNSIKRSLGYFDSEEDAARAYNNAAISFFGEFAAPNLLSGRNGIPRAPSPI